MRTYDFAAIGVGPFNLGLAALTEDRPELDGIFLEQRAGFDWHPGLMIEGVTIQVPFLADLVTMADPTSRFSFLNYLKQVGRLYPFYIRESFFPLRAEYNAYCKWVAAQMSAIRWNTRVDSVTHDGEAYLVHAAGETFRARKLVLGVGTAPRVPAVVDQGPYVHSADYLPTKAKLQQLDSITVVGSGQSAAEIYHDLLADIDTYGYHLSWITRSPRFFPMEYTKLTLEMTSPDYIRYHHGLPMPARDRLAREQRNLYKGISGDLINAIYETLYAKSLAGPVPTTLLSGAELDGVIWDEAEGRYTLTLSHSEQGRSFTASTQGLVLATGYAARVPSFLDPVRDRIRWDARGRFDVAVDYSVDVHGDEIFVQNAEEHTHSLTAPDLGMGPYRNSVILKGLTGHEIYPIEERIAFQQFGAPTADLPRQLVTS
ncbi:lysine N(6)-hydroxylase/L-ornithine N(5)-oxygenase family protein [Actinoplanes teichomyceticus]|uniref:L-lysine N6-monooxygenase MbtG n=1 Tax=Actinoplanes teichomyceticus TaxID=1867 RepID=A0A561WMM9_ACTTI|nr:SidA/IucD/PvdA family monooxygenase [Actinoplanes teichomyceticus]TWG25126.1 lysine N6-hydroxylase [Actinoplanes teichomyceticus]GIF10197.1 monooxygenase [Actinoplanes teichomyceticus]